MTDKDLSVQDVYNVFADHMNQLDKLWPDTEQFGPRKVHIVELIDAIKLRLVQVAEKNQEKHESAFDRAARKITGSPRPSAPSAVPEPTGKTAMQLAHEAAQARMRRQ